jgi:hypothetical protein
MASVVVVQSDDLAAWIGVAGVAVGIILTTGLEWWRDRRVQRRDSRRELRAAAHDLIGSSTTLLAVASWYRTEGKGRLEWLLAMNELNGRVTIAAYTINRLATELVAQSAWNVKNAVDRFSDIDTWQSGNTSPLNVAQVTLTVAVDAFSAAFIESDIGRPPLGPTGED